MSTWNKFQRFLCLGIHPTIHPFTQSIKWIISETPRCKANSINYTRSPLTTSSITTRIHRKREMLKSSVTTSTSYNEQFLCVYLLFLSGASVTVSFERRSCRTDWLCLVPVSGFEFNEWILSDYLLSIVHYDTLRCEKQRHKRISFSKFLCLQMKNDGWWMNHWRFPSLQESESWVIQHLSSKNMCVKAMYDNQAWRMRTNTGKHILR